MKLQHNFPTQLDNFWRIVDAIDDLNSLSIQLIATFPLISVFYFTIWKISLGKKLVFAWKTFSHSHGSLSARPQRQQDRIDKRGHAWWVRHTDWDYIALFSFFFSPFVLCVQNRVWRLVGRRMENFLSSSSCTRLCWCFFIPDFLYATWRESRLRCGGFMFGVICRRWG